MKHFLCRHTFIYMCDVFVRYMYFFVLCLIPKVFHRSIMALSWTCVGEAGISCMANLRSISVIAPLDINIPRPPAHRQTSTFARHRAQPGMSTARERKIARFFFARRNALAFSELRPFQEKFSKISPKFLRQKFGVCAKSPYLCTRKTEMRPTTPHKSEAIRSLKTLHKTIL